MQAFWTWLHFGYTLATPWVDLGYTLGGTWVELGWNLGRTWIRQCCFFLISLDSFHQVKQNCLSTSFASYWKPCHSLNSVKHSYNHSRSAGGYHEHWTISSDSLIVDVDAYDGVGSKSLSTLHHLLDRKLIKSCAKLRIILHFSYFYIHYLHKFS